MNSKILAFACAALIAGFTSCSKDSDTTPPEIPVGKTTYATIKLTQKQKSTRAAKITAKPTTQEETINSASLYIFNGSMNFLKKVDFEIANPSNTASKTVELTTGDHYFLALVNAPSPVPNFTPGATLEAVIKGTTNQYTVSNIDIITSGGAGFFMSTMKAPEKLTLVESTEAEANTKNPIELQVGRGMAKVNCSFEIANVNTDMPLTGLLSDVQYQPANNPTKMFLLPDLSNGLFYTPFEPSNGSAGSTPTYYPVLTNDFTMTGFKPAQGNQDELNIFYMTENYNSNPREGYSTFLLIKGKFSPKVEYSYDGDGNSLSANINGTFWVASNEAGTEIYKKRFFSEEPKTTTLAALSAEVGVEYTHSVMYDGGYAYYKFYLRDDMQSTRQAKYATPRNTYYGVTITSVYELGSNTPGTLIDDPETPLGEEAWLYATLEVIDWNTVEQSGGI